jgi:hypothetical protein
MSKAYEMIDGKRIPMRYWKVKLSSKEMSLIMICITESVLFDFMQEQNDIASLKILKGKIKMANKLLKIFGVRQLDKGITDKLEGAIENAKHKCEVKL